MGQITARTPLTVTELETLAVMLDSGSRRMSRTLDTDGISHVWEYSRGLGQAQSDMFDAFHELRQQAIYADPKPAVSAAWNVRISG
jgi:hypothetical protein